MNPRTGGIIQVNISDRKILQSSYMPFVNGGGLFIPSNLAVKMSQEIFVFATFQNNHKKFL